jgi:hypothetical protein
MNLLNVTLSVLVVGATIQAGQAQTKSGATLLSANLSYYGTKSTDTSAGGVVGSGQSTESETRQFSFSPQVGYFVADGLVIGFSGGLTTEHITHQQDNFQGVPDFTYVQYQDRKSFSVGPLVRYYRMLGEKTALYGQLAGGYQRTADKGNKYGSVSKGGYANLMPGFVYFPTPRIGLELTVGQLSYTKGHSDVTRFGSGVRDSQSSYRSLGASFGLRNLGLGVAFHLGG